MKNPLVSVVITTKNEELVIEDLLRSIKKQSYSPIEIIIIDNSSTDKTREIAKKYTKYVFKKGPERSSQRNFGAKKAKGKYILFLDADMELSRGVIEECVRKVQNSDVGGVVIPEESVGIGFWAKVKAFERSFYVGDDTTEAARFFDRSEFLKLSGFDENITGTEDWDLSMRVQKNLGLARAKNFIYHNEEQLSLWKLMKKKYYYGKNTKIYLSKNKISSISPQTIFFLRKAFYKKPQKLIAHPILTLAMICMLFLETIAGGFGYYKKK